MSNPHGYEPGFTIEQHRDELIERLSEAIRRIGTLEAECDAAQHQGLDGGRSAKTIKTGNIPKKHLQKSKQPDPL